MLINLNRDMAAFEDITGPDLELFADRGWADWQDAVESEGNGGSNCGNTSQSSRPNKEVAYLKRQDFGLFGHCPAKDNFFVVICEHCHLPFKPQAFCYHIEKHHKSKGRAKSAPLIKEETSQAKTTLFERKNYANERDYAKRSPMSTDNVSSASLGISLKKRPHKAPLCTAIKQALGKVGDPTRCKSPGSTLQQKGNFVKRNPGAVKSSHHVTNFTSATDNSKQHMGTNKLLPFNEQLASGKSPSRHKPSLDKPSKTSMSLPTKPHHKLKTENLKRLADDKHHHHVNKSAHSNKVAKRNNTYSYEGDHFSSTPHHTVHHGSQHNISNGPIVVLEKSNQLLTKENLIISSNAKPTSSSFRPYKHNHNPQLDIVKSSDRGESTKQLDTHKASSIVPEKIKKNIPLKAREYDPNKHCGVLLSSDNTRCTRSLTCKSHARSIKRKVPGRRKPYDELLLDHARAKKHLKERSISSSASLPPSSLTEVATLSVRSATVSVPSSDHLGPKSSSGTFDNSSKVSLSNVAKSHAHSQSGNPVHLFPRRPPPCYVDFWQKSSFEIPNESLLDANQTAMAMHPMPLAMSQYGSRMLNNRHMSFSRRKDFQQKKALSHLRNSFGKKQNFVYQDTTQYTTAAFTQIPSLMSSALTFFRPPQSNIANPFTREQASDYVSYGALQPTEIYADSLMKTSVPQMQHLKHIPLSKSTSFDSNGLNRRSNSTSHRKLQRTERYTIDTITGPLPKSLKSSLPLDNRLDRGMMVDNQVYMTKNCGGKFVPLSTSSRLLPSSGSTTIDLNSILKRGGDGKDLLNDLQANTGAPVSSQIQKLKRSGKSRKTQQTVLLEPSVTGKSNTRSLNYHLQDDMNFFNIEPASSSTSQDHPNVRLQGRTKDEFDDDVAIVSSVVNGVTSSTLSSWLQESAALGVSTNDNPSEFTGVPHDHLNFPGNSSAYVKKIFQNTNNSNNCTTQQNVSMPHFVDFNGPNSDPIQITTDASVGHLLREAATETGILDVDHFAVEENNNNLAVEMNHDNYNNGYTTNCLTSELISLLDPGGGEKDTVSNQDFSSFPKMDIEELGNM